MTGVRGCQECCCQGLTSSLVTIYVPWSPYTSSLVTIYVRPQRGLGSILRRKMEPLHALDNPGPADKLVHNLSSKTLTQGQIGLLQWDAGHNLMDARTVDFLAALEPAVQQIGANDETRSSIRQRVTGLLMAHR